MNASELKALKPKKSLYRRTAGGGLYIEVTPNGSKLWRHRYRYSGRENMLTLGKYPKVSLKEARRRRDEQRDLLDEGKDPSEERRYENFKRSGAYSFKVVAEGFQDALAEKTRTSAEDTRARFVRWVYPAIGSKSVDEVTFKDVTLIIQRIEFAGRGETEILHEFTWDGLHVRSFGELFGEPPGHPVQRGVTTRLKVACPDSATVVVAAGNLAEVRAYDLADGRLTWTDSIPGFVPILTEIDVAPPGLYMQYAPFGATTTPDRHVAFHRLRDGSLLAQSESRRKTPGEELVVGSCVIAPDTGVCATRSESLPRIFAISDGRAVILEDRIFPSVSLVEVRY